MAEKDTWEPKENLGNIEDLVKKFEEEYGKIEGTIINFIWPYLHQFFNDSHSLNGYEKPLKKPFDQC